MTQIRDWATSVFADDVTGVTDARFLEPSWNMRSIFPSLVNSANAAARQVSADGRSALRRVAGERCRSTPAASAFLRFCVPASGQASIDWSSAGLPVSPLMQFTVVRTQ